jgi:hypothetical protein
MPVSVPDHGRRRRRYRSLRLVIGLAVLAAISAEPAPGGAWHGPVTHAAPTPRAAHTPASASAPDHTHGRLIQPCPPVTDWPGGCAATETIDRPHGRPHAPNVTLTSVAALATPGRRAPPSSTA